MFWGGGRGDTAQNDLKFYFLMKVKAFLKSGDQKELNTCEVNGVFSCHNKMQSFILTITAFKNHLINMVDGSHHSPFFLTISLR